jgi:hypothetical protein
MLLLPFCRTLPPTSIAARTFDALVRPSPTGILTRDPAFWQTVHMGTIAHCMIRSHPHLSAPTVLLRFCRTLPLTSGAGRTFDALVRPSPTVLFTRDPAFWQTVHMGATAHCILRSHPSSLVCLNRAVALPQDTTLY